MASRKNATIEDVAKKARVSAASVSRVLSNSPGVKDHLRKKVEFAVSELNYELPKGRIRAKEGNRIGLILPDLENPYFTQLIKGVQNAARVTGFEFLICDSCLDPNMEVEHVERLMNTFTKGFIYIPFAPRIPSIIYELMKQDKHPIVFLDREVEHPRICSVVSDNEEGAFQATSYLLKLGHRKILYLSGPEHFSTSKTRAKGFEQGLKEGGLNLDDQMVEICDTTFDDAFQKTLSAYKKDKSFSAVFASNDLMAFGAWKALEKQGLKIPEDMSIIGFDGIRIAAQISLTTIAQPAFEIGRNAVHLLSDLIEKRRKAPQRILLRDSLIIRNSCKRIG